MEKLQTNYNIIKEIGIGAFARVFLAEHKILRQTVAIKVIQINEQQGHHTLAAIQQEADLLKSLTHPYITTLYDFILTPETAFLVMEYLEGGSLLERINTNGPIAESTAKEIFFQLINAIYYLQQMRVVHRDIKIENILFDKFRNIRLIDFGLSRSMSDTNSIIQTQCGSLSFAAPEMIVGKSYGASVDIWSAGVVLYTMVTGQLPFEDTNLKNQLSKIINSSPSYPPNLSPSLIDLIDKLLTKNPDDRIRPPDILKHPWLSPVVRPIIMENMDNLDREVLNKLEMCGYHSEKIAEDFCNRINSDGVVAYRIAFDLNRLQKNSNLNNRLKRNLLIKRNVPVSPFRQMPISPIMRPQIVVPQSLGPKRRLSFSQQNLLRNTNPS